MMGILRDFLFAMEERSRRLTRDFCFEVTVLTSMSIISSVVSSISTSDLPIAILRARFLELGNVEHLSFSFASISCDFLERSSSLVDF